MIEESNRQMEQFWTKILIGDAAAGAVLLAPEGAAAAALRLVMRAGPVIRSAPLRPVPVP